MNLDRPAPPWPRVLRRKLLYLLLVKLGLLTLLWALFFSAAHRTVVDSKVNGDRWGLTPNTHSETMRD